MRSNCQPFSDYYQNQQAQKPTERPSAPRVVDDQGRARNAMAMAQMRASQRARFETRQPHYHINGRFYLHPSEAKTMPEPKPVDEKRLQWLRQLREEIGLKKSDS